MTTELLFPIACGLMGMLCGMVMMTWKCRREFEVE